MLYTCFMSNYEIQRYEYRMLYRFSAEYSILAVLIFCSEYPGEHETAQYNYYSSR